MTDVKYITTPGGEELAVLPRAEFEALAARAASAEHARAEDADDVRVFDAAMARGGASLPLDVWAAMEAAPSPIGPLRKHRRMTQEALAEAAGVTQPYLSKLESGGATGDVYTLRAIAAALGAVAGILIAPITFTSYEAGVMLGLKGFSAAIVGGIGNLGGAMAGGVSLGGAEALAPLMILDPLGVTGPSQLRDAVAFTLLILVLLIKPTGLFGERLSSEDRA